MKFKKVRYYLLMCTLVLLFGSYIGVSFFVTPTSANTNPPISDPTEDLIPDEEPDQPTDIPGVDEEEEGLPTDPIDLINYSLNILNNGKGCAASFEFIVSNTGIYAGAKVGVTQYMIGNTYRCGGQSMEEAYFYYTNADPLVEPLLVSNNLVMEEYRAVNVDKDADSIIVVGTEDYNFDARTYNLNADSGYKKTYSVQQGLEKLVYVQSLEFPFEISKKTATVKSYDTRSNKNFITVKISYNVDMLPEEFDWYYKKNGTLPVCTYTEYNYTFVIAKNTGNLKRMIREESFTSYTDSVPGGITINSKATFNQTFTSMNKEVEVKKPYLSYTK